MEFVPRGTLCQICHERLKPRKLVSHLPLFERGFCKHLRMRQRNLKPFIKSVRALVSTLDVFDGSYYYEI